MWDTNKSTMTAAEIAAQQKAWSDANRARIAAKQADGSWNPDGLNEMNWWLVGGLGLGVVVLLTATRGRG